MSTPPLLCTTKNHSSTTLYYKELILATKYYSSTTLCYQLTLMIDPCHIGTVIYIARSNRNHPPTSPNTGPATKNRSWLKPLTYATSFTRGAVWLTLEIHPMLRLPRKMTFMIDPAHIWNVIYNARSNKRQASPSNFTKYCAWHGKWFSWLILITYQWNIIYNARSNSTHLPTSPNIAPATQSFLLRCSRSSSSPCRSEDLFLVERKCNNCKKPRYHGSPKQEKSPNNQHKRKQQLRYWGS